MSGDQMPKREGRSVQIKGDDAGLVQRDLDKLFRALAQFHNDHYDINVTITGITIANHHARHENGGADEVSVAGLSGLLADRQTPLAHDIASATYHNNVTTTVGDPGSDSNVPTEQAVREAITASGYRNCNDWSLVFAFFTGGAA